MDARPQIVRTAHRAAVASVLLIAGCTLLGAGIAAEIVVHYTQPHAPHGVPKETS